MDETQPLPPAALLPIPALREEYLLLDAQLQRGAARQSFAQWCEFRGFRLAKHHRLIVDETERFLNSASEQVLLLLAPPGCGKSTYISLLLPEWYLSRHPTHRILAATHSDEFAGRWGRRVRNDIALYGNHLGLELAHDSAANDRWALITGGEYYGVGAGVGIAGYRAELGIGDDFFGKREDAWSEIVRKKRWDWYIDDFTNRLTPGGKRVLMNTRWHDDDVAGHVHEQIKSGRIRGRIIEIRAIAEDNDPLGRAPGTYLWDDDPEYAYGEWLRERQREATPIMWSALYQQRPVPEAGDYFRREWFRTYTKLPPRAELRIYGASDYAVSERRSADYTVHIVVGIDPDGRMYVLDVWREQSTSDRWVESFCDLVKEWHPMLWGEEGGPIKASVGPLLTRRQRERKAYVLRESFPPQEDKQLRAQSIRGRIALEGLYLPERAPWLEPFLAELLRFPASTHDDQVDALGLIGLLLDQMVNGAKTKPAPPKKKSDYVAHERADYGSLITL